MINFENGGYFSYETIGEFQSDGEWIHPRRTIDSFELIFVLEGTVLITENGTNYEISKNNMIILEPFMEHFGTKMTTERVVFYWFHFKTNKPIAFKTAENRQEYDIKYLLKKLLHIANTSGYTKSSADSLGYLIYEELLQISRKKLESPSVTVNLIKEYVKNNSNRNITVKEIAQKLKYNSDYIGKLFKAETGISLKQYISERRLKLAKDYLITTDLKVKEIAEILDFWDENLFVKFFVYHEKITPSVFRKRHYNTHINNK